MSDRVDWKQVRIRNQTTEELMSRRSLSSPTRYTPNGGNKQRTSRQADVCFRSIITFTVVVRSSQQSSTGKSSS